MPSETSNLRSPTHLRLGLQHQQHRQSHLTLSSPTLALLARRFGATLRIGNLETLTGRILAVLDSKCVNYVPRFVSLPHVLLNRPSRRLRCPQDRRKAGFSPAGAGASAVAGVDIMGDMFEP